MEQILLRVTTLVFRQLTVCQHIPKFSVFLIGIDEMEEIRHETKIWLRIGI